MGPHIHSKGYPSNCQCTYLLQNVRNNTHACRTSEVSAFRHILHCLHCLMRQELSLCMFMKNSAHSSHQKALLLAGPG